MDWLREHLWESWLAAAIVLSIAEMFSLDLFLIMLATGAVAGMVLAVVGAPFAVQAIGAAAVALAMIAFVRKPVAQRFHRGPELTVGPGRLIGQRAVVTTEITQMSSGLVRLDGETWTAATTSDAVLRPGDPVEVERIDGATAYVRSPTDS